MGNLLQKSVTLLTPRWVKPLHLRLLHVSTVKENHCIKCLFSSLFTSRNVNMELQPYSLFDHYHCDDVMFIARTRANDCLATVNYILLL
jgi:hypothetical protein